MLLNENCPWCGQPLYDYTWNREHIIPNSMCYSNLHNIMRAHKTCNRLRNTKLDIIGINPDNNTLIIPDMYRHMDEDMLYYTIRAMYIYSPILLRDLQFKIERLENNIKMLEKNSPSDDALQTSMTAFGQTYSQINDEYTKAKDEYTKLNNLVNAIKAGTIDINRNFNET